MKKILLASTALALSATLANAQALNITGGARMGVLAENVSGGPGWQFAQENRLQFNFNVSVEADHGLTFGAWSRARITNGSTGVFSGSRVWVESNGFRLTFGNVDGAIRGAGVSHGYAGGCAVGYVGGHTCADAAGLVGVYSFALPGNVPPLPASGVIAPSVTQGQSSTGTGNASMVRVDYSMGDTRVALSHQRGGATEIGVRTSFDAFTVAAGYSNAGTGVTTVSGHYNGGSWGAGVVLARIAGFTNWSISGNAALGGGDLYGYVGRVYNARAFGLSYGYGLGGGATLTAGLESLSGGGNRVTTASVGVSFGF